VVVGAVVARLTDAEVDITLVRMAHSLSATNRYWFFRERRPRRWEERFIAKMHGYLEEYTRG
jgi:hypothetical protein